MTTNDPHSGRSAARRLPALGLLRFLCSALLCAAALPALAQQAEPAAKATVETAPTEPATSLVMIDPMPIPERALLFAGNLNHLVGSPSAQVATSNGPAGRVQSLLMRALALLGTPYRWGGTSPERGFDCSGLVGYVFRSTLGIELPRISRDMARNGQLISERTALTAGDLVFFGRRGRVNHVGIYVGEGQFVHAPRTGRDVTVSSLDSGYWSGKFMQARRVAGI